MIQKSGDKCVERDPRNRTHLRGKDWKKDTGKKTEKPAATWRRQGFGEARSQTIDCRKSHRNWASTRQTWRSVAGGGGGDVAGLAGNGDSRPKCRQLNRTSAKYGAAAPGGGGYIGISGAIYRQENAWEDYAKVSSISSSKFTKCSAVKKSREEIGGNRY